MVQRELGWRTGQNQIERRRVGRAMYVAVLLVREGHRISVPVVLVFGDVVSWHCKDFAIVTFDLTVRLWVIRGGEDVQDPEKRADSLEEFRGELLSVIRDQRLRWTIFKHPCFEERNGNRISVNPS